MLATKSETAERIPCDVYPRAESVRLELEKVFESSSFKATPRRRKLLRYLVEELLAGRGRQLKGYTIATLVFERDESFDPQTDPVVRLEARRLRHDLDGYYATEGRVNALRIKIPKGQYAPVIEWMEETTEPFPVPLRGDVEERAVGPSQAAEVVRRPRFVMLAAALGFVAFVCLLVGLIYVFNKPSGGLVDGRILEKGASLVVLPFKSSGNGSPDDGLADAMTDEVVTSIGRFVGARLYMPSGTQRDISEEDPVDVGRTLGLSYVMIGSVDLDPENRILGVTARLIDVETQHILWIGSYDRHYSAPSLRAAQRQIANAIALALGQANPIP